MREHIRLTIGRRNYLKDNFLHISGRNCQRRAVGLGDKTRRMYGLRGRRRKEKDIYRDRTGFGCRRSTPKDIRTHIDCSEGKIEIH